MSILCRLAVPIAEGQDRDIDKTLKRFAPYHVLTLRERNSDARDFFLAHFPKANPSIVHADFDGDGHADYAILLRDHKSGAAKLVVLLCSEDAKCRGVFELDVTSDFGEVYVRPVPIGSSVSQTDAINTKIFLGPVRLSSTGIEVTYFGQSKVVYYWNRKHKKMEAVQTED